LLGNILKVFDNDSLTIHSKEAANAGAGNTSTNKGNRDFRTFASKMKTFVLGDIHGARKALVQCLDRSGFNRGKDRLIVLGDVCDGYPDVRESIDELLGIEHCDYIIGNHDLWALDWALNRTEKSIWLTQGGANTVASYGGRNMPSEHIDFLKNAHWFIELDRKLFIHGGFDPGKGIARQDLEFLTWDRSLVAAACRMAAQDPGYRFSTYEEIFVGHTPTQQFSRMEMSDDLTPGKPAAWSDTPLFLCNVIMMDTGAGWSGKLTIMDVHSHEYWQSDPTLVLYGGRGR
jgi:serine/threonine protein phosphatase 1